MGDESEEGMKRFDVSLVAVSLAIALGLIFQPLVAKGQTVSRFSAPVLIGGGPVEEGKPLTDATDAEFIEHPEAPGATNFADDTGQVIPDGYLPRTIHDIAATPGMTGGEDVGANSEMVMQLIGMGPLQPLNGIAPNHFVIYDDANDNGLVFGINFQLSGENIADHRLMMGDIRNASQNEFHRLFGRDPLEEGLIGNSSEVPPYKDRYPAAVKTGSKPFQWCYPFPKLLGLCDPGGRVLQEKDYNEIFLYDMADTGDALVAVSHDPFRLNVNPEIGFGLFSGGLGGIRFDAWLSARSAGDVSYISPLTFFYKDRERYRFLGNTSLHLPKVTLSDREGGIRELWKFMFTQHIFPMATGAIAIEAIDSDLAVLYRSTLFDLAETVPDNAGRSRVFADGQTHRWGEMLGRCAERDPQGGCMKFFSFAYKPELLPDDLLAPVLFWKKAREWLPGSYEHMNPGDVYEPYPASLVGDNAYSMATLSDPGKKYLLVPSNNGTFSRLEGAFGLPAEFKSKMLRVIYKIDPEGERIWLKRIMGTPQAPEIFYSESPFILPEVIAIEVPDANHIPYQIVTGDLDGNGCGDFAVTWRGKYMTDDIKFSDGLGGMFHNGVTAVLRGGRPCGIVKIKQINLPLRDAQVASAAIADVDGLPGNELVIGNLVPEMIKCNRYEDNTQNNCEADGGKYAAFAYIFDQESDFSALRAKRLRVGALSSTKKDRVMGVGRAVVDYVDGGPDAMAFINGLPIMLNEVGCPNEDKKEVVSPFEIYKSIFYNKHRYDANLPPLVDEASHPIPRRCAETTLQLRDGPIPPEIIPEIIPPEIIPPIQPVGRLPGQPDETNSQMASISQDEDYDGETSEGGVETDYAKAWRPDIVYASRGDAIADMRDTRPAQATTGGDLVGQGTATSTPLTDLLLSDIIAQFGGQFTDSQMEMIGNLEASVRERLNTIDDPLLIDLLSSILLAIKPDEAYGFHDGGLKGMPFINEAYAGGPPPLIDLIDIGEIPLPRGRIMPGPRDMSAVMLFEKSLCDRDGMVDDIEECDTAGLTDEEAAGQIDVSCKPRDGRGAIACDLRNCSCLYSQPACTKDDECTRDFDCGIGNICDSQCLCRDGGFRQPHCSLMKDSECKSDADCGEEAMCDVNCECRPRNTMQPHCSQRPGATCTSDADCSDGFICGIDCECKAMAVPVEGPPVTVGNTDCECRIETTSSNAAWENLEEMNRKYIQIPSGRLGDFRIFEPGQMALCMCRVDGAAAPGTSAEDLTLSRSGTPLPDQPGNILPWMIVQTKGSKFADIARREAIELVDNPIRILPLETTDQERAGPVILPQLGAGIELGEIAGAVPMSATSVVGLANNVTIVNDMIEHQVVALGAGQLMSQALGASGGLAAEPAEEADAGSAIHIIRFRVPEDCPSIGDWRSACPWVEREEDLYAENRIFDLNRLRDTVSQRVAEGHLADTSLFADLDLDWPVNMRYNLVLLQDVYGERGLAVGQGPKTTALSIDFYAGSPQVALAGGGGCECQLTDAPVNLNSILPTLITIAFASGGVAIARVRMRKRK